MVDQWLAIDHVLAKVAAVFTAGTALCFGACALILHVKITDNFWSRIWIWMYVATVMMLLPLLAVLLPDKKVRMWVIAALYTLSTVVSFATRCFLLVRYGIKFPDTNEFLVYALSSLLAAVAWTIYSFKVEFHPLHSVGAVAGIISNLSYCCYCVWKKFYPDPPAAASSSAAAVVQVPPINADSILQEVPAVANIGLLVSNTAEENPTAGENKVHQVVMPNTEGNPADENNVHQVVMPNTEGNPADENNVHQVVMPNIEGNSSTPAEVNDILLVPNTKENSTREEVIIVVQT